MERSAVLYAMVGSLLVTATACETSAPTVAPTEPAPQRVRPKAVPSVAKEIPPAPAAAPSPIAPRRLATGGIYSCVVRAGRVYCWGLARDHPPGEAFAIAGIDDAVEVAAGYDAACARREKGAVVCWNEQATWPIADVSRANSVAVGQSMACAAQPEGVQCWTPNFSKDKAPTARLVHGVQDPIQVAAGFYHACALERGGAVKCWGEDPNGVLGALDSGTPNFDQGRSNAHDWVAQMIDTGGVELELEPYWKQAKGLETDLLRCVGHTGGGAPSHAMEFKLDLDGEGTVTDVVLASSEFGKLATNAMNRCVTEAYFDAPEMRPISGRPTTIEVKLLFQSRARALTTAHAVLDGAVALASRGYFSCAVLADGSLQCWGITHGFDGAGIHGTRLESMGRPAGVDDVEALETISIGWRHACGRRKDGTHVCLGANVDGGFGAGIPIDTAYVIRDVDTAREYAEISAGPTLSCGIRTDASVWCWGNNEGGRLGVGSKQGGTQPPAPVVGLPSLP